LRLLILTPAELSRDPRARRAALTAHARGIDVVGLCGQVSGLAPIPLEGLQIVRVGGERLAAGLRSVGLGGMAKEDLMLVREARGLYRLGRLGRLTAGLVRAGRKLGSFDVVHANDLDTLPAAALLARRSGARLVYDAHELYTTQEPDPPRVHQRVSSSLESRLARRADAVVTVSKPIAEELRRRLGLEETPHVVLNCPPLVEAKGKAPLPGSPLAAVYQGAMGPGRPLEDLLLAADNARGVHFTLRIAGADPGSLRAKVEQRGLTNVEVVEPVPPDRLVDALAGFEVGLVINRPVTQNDELVLPNKLFEYLMAGLAVAVPRLPGMTPLVEEADFGVTYEPGRPDALAAALRGLSSDPDRLAELRANARFAAVQRLNSEAQEPLLMRAWGLGGPADG
jgi:glycosyltransferase involved in cell wall biosynthesis